MCVTEAELVQPTVYFAPMWTTSSGTKEFPNIHKLTKFVNLRGAGMIEYLGAQKPMKFHYFP